MQFDALSQGLFFFFQKKQSAMNKTTESISRGQGSGCRVRVSFDFVPPSAIPPGMRPSRQQRPDTKLGRIRRTVWAAFRDYRPPEKRDFVLK